MRLSSEVKKGELSNNIYLKLKEMIYSGHLKPHETLNLKELASSFNTSITPINSAISLLAKEGHVIKQPNRSSTVAAMSIDEVKNIWLTGALLEGMAAYLAASRITAKEILFMETVIEKSKEKQVPDDASEVKELNRQFHGLFLRACKNKELLKLIKENSWKLYRYYVLIASFQGTLQDFINQHKLIVENFKKRDPHGARDAVEKHIISAGEKVIKCLEIGLV